MAIQPGTTTVALSRATTRSASLQTFYIIRLLADRESRDDAYRAYAYFRWVDDWLDSGARSLEACAQFVERQKALIARAYAGQTPACRDPSETIVVDLIHHCPDSSGRLAAYIHNMLAVMEFDAARRGCWITQDELDAYQRSLAVAVTECMHFFIGRRHRSPSGPDRYAAVTGAHIAHMLRDMCEDVGLGYYNIPVEFLESAGLSPEDLGDVRFRQWVRSRVQTARQLFRRARLALRRAGSLRYRLAASIYMARFGLVLDRIEQDGYRLRESYPAAGRSASSLRAAGLVFASSLQAPDRESVEGGAGRDLMTHS